MKLAGLWEVFVDEATETLIPPACVGFHAFAKRRVEPDNFSLSSWFCVVWGFVVLVI